MAELTFENPTSVELKSGGVYVVHSNHSFEHWAIFRVTHASEATEHNRRNAGAASKGPDLAINVVDAKGTPISGVNCRVVVGGYPSRENGYPGQPDPKNMLNGMTNVGGIVEFRHDGLKSEKRHIIYLDKENFSSETRFVDAIDEHNKNLHVVLFNRQFVTLRYEFQPKESLSFAGDGIVKGTMVLYPEEGGSYRPPARAHFNLAENRRVGSGGVLATSTPGIELDQKMGKVYFGGSNGRFDHCTDLGSVKFDAVTEVDPDMLQRKREDTEIHQGHTYIYESNIYEAKRRTKFTGLDVRYAKIVVESIDAADIPNQLTLKPDPILAGERLSVSYHPGSLDLHGARDLKAYWATYDAKGKTQVDMADVKKQPEFPSESRGTEGGEFKYGRKRCRVEKMADQKDGFWKCEFTIPANAKTLALVFVDELERTSSGGIVTFPIGHK